MYKERDDTRHNISGTYKRHTIHDSDGSRDRQFNTDYSDKRTKSMVDINMESDLQDNIEHHLQMIYEMSRYDRIDRI